MFVRRLAIEEDIKTAKAILDRLRRTLEIKEPPEVQTLKSFNEGKKKLNDMVVQYKTTQSLSDLIVLLQTVEQLLVIAVKKEDSKTENQLMILKEHAHFIVVNLKMAEEIENKKGRELITRFLQEEEKEEADDILAQFQRKKPHGTVPAPALVINAQPAPQPPVTSSSCWARLFGCCCSKQSISEQDVDAAPPSYTSLREVS